MTKRTVTAELLSGLKTGFRTDFKRGIGRAPATYKGFTTVVPSSTKTNTYGWLGEFPIFREWIGERRVKQLEERAYILANRKFEVSVELSIDDIEDDNLGMYPSLIEGWGMEGEALKDRLAHEALANGHQRECFDGQNFFDSEHPMGDGVVFSNIDTTGATQPWYVLCCDKPLLPVLYQNRQEASFDMIDDPKSEYVFLNDAVLAGGKARGAAGYTMWQLARRMTSAVTANTWEDVKEAFASIKDANGEPLGLKPTHCVFGTSTLAAGQNLFDKANLAGGESNIYYKAATIIDAPRLP